MLAAAMDVQATPANGTLQATYDRAGPQQRRRLLESLDSFAAPQAATQGKSARRQLARMVRYDMQRWEYVRSMVADAPPVSPEAVQAIVRIVELGRLNDNAVKKLLRAADE